MQVLIVKTETGASLMLTDVETLTAGETTITVTWQGSTITLPAEGLEILKTEPITIE